MTLPGAIARQEGFCLPGSRACRNNNPGNLRWGPFAKAHGATHDDDAGYAVFPDAATGRAALVALLIGPAYKGLTVAQCLNKYAPAADHNEPSAYIADVCAWCGCTPETVIDGLMEEAP